MNGHLWLETFRSGLRRWSLSVGIVVWALVGCGGKATDGVLEPGGDGDGDGDGDSDSGPIGDGDSDPIGDGDGDGGPIGDGDGVFNGRLTPSDGTWDGYSFVASSEHSAVMATGSTGPSLCVNGTLGGGYEQWALFGWNIAQVIDPVTGEGGAVRAIAPGGTGVNVQVMNNGGSGLRVQIQTDAEASEFWCASLPAVGGTIPWGSFTKECWAPGGEAYARRVLEQLHLSARNG